MQDVYQFTIQLKDQVSGTLAKLGAGVNSAHGQLMKMQTSWDKLGRQFMYMNQANQLIRDAAATVEQISKPGIAFQSSIADLKAITGMTDEQLKGMGKAARQLGKEFGTDASRGVESYKLLLSQLSPELAKTPEVLNAMAKNANVLSKAMGNDLRAGTEVLTTAMNQFQVDISNPTAALREMTDMMNIMSAAAQEGSAELPMQKRALEEVGMAAKAAKVGFSETTSALQILDKAGKRGSEGGVALRNILSITGQGRFLPQSAQEELRAAGVDIDVMADKTLTLAERLTPLKNVMGDTALMTRLFGRENYTSAVALVSGIDRMVELEQKITGTNTAFEQADVIMGTHQERMNRWMAKAKDLGVSIFGVTKNVLPFTAAFAQSAQMITQFVPIMAATRMGFIKGYQSTVKMVWGIRALTAAQLKANLAFLASPMGLVVAGVAAAAGAYLLLRNRINSVSAAKRAMNDVNSRAQKSIVEEKVEVERLVKVMHSENATREQKGQAYNRLIQISPEYFGKLTREQALTDDLNVAKQKYIEKLLREAKVQARRDKLIEVEKDLLDMQNQDPGAWSGFVNFAHQAIVKPFLRNSMSPRQKKYLDLVEQRRVLEGSVSDDAESFFDARGGEGGGGMTGGGTVDPVSENMGGGDLVGGITSGGRRHTNIHINVGNMIETFAVTTNRLDETPEEIREKVVEALLMSINSANSVARS